MDNENKIGKRIKAYREKLEMSPADLADRSQVSVAVIEAIEDGMVVPALGILVKISRALGQRLGTFTDDQWTPDPVITRSADLKEMPCDPTKSLGYVSRNLASGKSDRHMDPFYIEFPAEGENMASKHEGEELLICLTGEIELLYGKETFVLGPGDTAYYNSIVTHGVKAHGGKPATIYGIIFTPM